MILKCVCSLRQSTRSITQVITSSSSSVRQRHTRIRIDPQRVPHSHTPLRAASVWNKTGFGRFAAHLLSIFIRLLGQLDDDELPFLWPIFMTARPHQALHCDLRVYVLSIVVVLEWHIDNANDGIGSWWIVVSLCFSNKHEKRKIRKGFSIFGWQLYDEGVRWQHSRFTNNTKWSELHISVARTLNESRGDKKMISLEIGQSSLRLLERFLLIVYYYFVHTPKAHVSYQYHLKLLTTTTKYKIDLPNDSDEDRKPNESQ